jgi:hypothetical protein
MKNIASDVEKSVRAKRAQIEKLEKEIAELIDGLERALKAVGRKPRGSSKTTAGRRGPRPGVSRRRRTGATRARRGQNKQKVYAVMSRTAMRLRDIAAAAGLATPAANSVLQAGVRTGEIVKGRKRGTYSLSRPTTNREASSVVRQPRATK